VEVNLETIGEQILVDPSVLSRLQGVLVHLINNAVAHGIEAPKERRRNRKASAARILIVVERVGDDSLAVEFSDDGRGFDVLRLRRAWQLMRGESADQTPTDVGAGDGATIPLAGLGLRLEHIEDRDISQAIEFAFQDGLTTAEQKDQYAGAGTGLPAVRYTIATMGGTVEVYTRPNEGSRFRLVVPSQQRIDQLLLVREERGMTVGVPARVAAAGPDGRVLRFANGATRRVDQVLGVIDALVSPPPFPFNHIRRISGTTVGPDGGVLFVVDADIPARQGVGG
jgi:hypothetical protein